MELYDVWLSEDKLYFEGMSNGELARFVAAEVNDEVNVVQLQNMFIYMKEFLGYSR